MFLKPNTFEVKYIFIKMTESDVIFTAKYNILVYFKLFLNDLFRRRVMNTIKISWMKPNMLISYSLTVSINHNNCVFCIDPGISKMVGKVRLKSHVRVL